MIGYITLGTNDKDKAKVFYDALLGTLGAKPFIPNDRIVLWSKEPGAPMLAIALPYDEQPATVGNGVMVALNVGDQDTVNKFYAKAIELGAQDEGAPGFRTDNFYGGYVRDLDGNKLVAYCSKQ